MFLRISCLERFIKIHQQYHMIRQGSNIQNLEAESKTTNKLMVWGIQKFYDHKQCYKYLKKNFTIEGNGVQDNITHLCKLRNKPFFILKLNNQINIDDFNKDYAKTKRVKVKPILEDTQLKNNIQDKDYIQLLQVKKPAQKVFKEVTEEQIQKIAQSKIQDIVASLHNMPYQEQVQHKTKQINKVIQKYNTAFFRDNQVNRLIKDQGKNIEPLIMKQFVQCQINRDGYRSKSQFTIGRDFYTKQPVIGFNKGNYFNNTIMVESPKNVNIISKSTKLIVAVVQNFIKTQLKKQQFEEFQPFDRVLQTGFWRYLVVRQSQRTKQTMIIVVCKTQGFDNQKLKSIKQNLTNYLKTAIIGLKSICFLSYNGQADCVPVQKPELLYGTPFYQQKIFDHTFQVSPSAFLQIHMDMCEVLYKRIIQSVKQCEVVLDLGSGIGTIGISIMKKLPQIKVIGVQICQQAVQDAKVNEPSYEVHLGRAQDHIKAICEEHRGKRIVAVLDPPRAGFNKQVMVALRRCRGLDNIIYVACNAGAIQDNLLQLTLPITARRKAPQFQIKQMIGLDLFPHTPHFEALYVMERKY